MRLFVQSRVCITHCILTSYILYLCLYRNLGVPVGALNPNRLEFFLERYRALCTEYDEQQQYKNNTTTNTTTSYSYTGISGSGGSSGVVDKSRDKRIMSNWASARSLLSGGGGGSATSEARFLRSPSSSNASSPEKGGHNYDPYNSDLPPPFIYGTHYSTPGKKDSM